MITKAQITVSFETNNILPMRFVAGGLLGAEIANIHQGPVEIETIKNII